MKTNQEIAQEILNEKREAEAAKNIPAKPQNAQVKGAKIAWMIGAFAIDLSTSYAVTLILFWWYGIAWIIAGAGGIVYSDWLRERVGNNAAQKKIAETGLTVSWLAIVFMAVLSGVALVMEATKNKYIEGFTIIFVLGLFFYHVYQSYRYSNLDDEYIARMEESKANEAAAKRIADIHRAARIVTERKKADALFDVYSEEHGEALAYALNKQPLAQPVTVFAKDIPVEELQTVNPTKAGESKRPQN